MSHQRTLLQYQQPWHRPLLAPKLHSLWQRRQVLLALLASTHLLMQSPLLLRTLLAVQQRMPSVLH